MENNRIELRQFLATAFEKGSYATDDIIAFLVPFLEEIADFHENNQVAPFEKEEAFFITDNRLDIDELQAHKAILSPAAVNKLLEPLRSEHFDIVGKVQLEANVDDGTYQTVETALHLNINEPLQTAAFIPGYSCYEILAGHHDEQTDIFCAGLILGSMALSLNLYDHEDLAEFVRYRINPVQYNNRIHPVISTLITEMTEPDRRKRSQDIYDILQRLKNYREFNPEKQTDLGNIPGWVNKEIKERRQFILSKLRTRLFDSSRRNRLLYYKPNMRFVNLTVSSVPVVLHYQSIRPEFLFTWTDDVSSKVKGMNELLLNKYLRFEDHLYLPSSLDKIRQESQRDIQEFGFSQLRLVISFLNWHNLKDNATERIQSPLLLIPAELRKVKRLKEDHYVLKVLDNEAEVNPILANHLFDLYGIRLPDFVDLDDMSQEQFYELLKKQIDSANQGIKLQYVNKPRIKLIHSVARQTMAGFNRRMKNRGAVMESYKSIPYSYDTEYYKPLGLEIFKQRIEPRAAFLEFLINEDITLSSNQLTGSQTRERELFEITESENNPYCWDYDVCNIVLGNFNYRKMSLVRDYNNLIDNNTENPVFDTLFSPKPRKFSDTSTELNKPEEWHHVVSSDPAQTNAVLHSRSGESFIIQGPPGTGKSQTITNLIADFTARGKSVLFICEKRAALDVVFHRLGQSGLDELCCYIHDSQGDKREFIKNLKNTYETYTGGRMDLEGIRKTRNELLQKMSGYIQFLNEFHQTHMYSSPEAGTEIKELINRLIELKEHIVKTESRDDELLPPYADWLKFGETITDLGNALEEDGAANNFASHPLSNVNDTVFLSDNPLNLLYNLGSTAQSLLKEIIAVLKGLSVDPEHSTYLKQIKNLFQDAVLLLPVAENENLQLVNIDNIPAKKFEEKIRSYKADRKVHETACKSAGNWVNKLSEADLQEAIRITQKNEKSFFSFLNGNWRRLKKQLKESYNFSAHQVKPTVTSILELLQEEYRTGNVLHQSRQQIQQEYGIENIDTAYIGIEAVRSKRGDKEVDYLLSHPQANNIVKKLYQVNNKLHQAEIQLQQCLHNYEDKQVSEILDELESILISADNFRDLLPVMKDFAQLPDNFKRIIRTLPVSPVQAEAVIAQKTLRLFYGQHKPFASADAVAVEKAVCGINNCYKQLQKINAAFIKASGRDRFIKNVELSNTAISQLSNEQKQFKKQYNEGRKILENEFGKSMRYKSIRELCTKDSGIVLKDLKPVWLMSPLSVSNSLPLDSRFFDVVIFDEASQITLEEGIPALYRSLQTIIVGDEKQMPPTNFFTAKSEDPDDLNRFEGEGDEELLTADADSLLVQGSRKLNSVLLNWHYRSRYETLISFSNHAFYSAGLLTIPDKFIHHVQKPPIEVTETGNAEKYADCLYDRSMSFHYLPASVYEKRTNTDEANYIASMVRELLKRKVKESIGIVAFSQEQQLTIENALASLAETDVEFEQLLEEAYNRTEDEQFTGLIIKNLENIQGDERDIIIMSVCYGFDAKRKMLMNFGPINKKGGEKRLNVIFSRAKKHMAVISSIKYHHITNEYNEGANYFRRFLQYSEHVSSGNMDTARTILDSLVINKKDLQERNLVSLTGSQISEQLVKLGYETTTQVGQSGFKCSIAVKKKKSDDHYSLGILIDDSNHYSNPNLVEQYYQRPAALQSFGWKTMHVFAKDWLHQPEKVIEQIIKQLERGDVGEENDVDEVTTGISAEVLDIKVEQQTSDYLRKSSIPGYEDVVFEHLIFSGSGSSSFWEAGVKENKLFVRFGRVGSKGQIQVKTFNSSHDAEREKVKMINEKLAKGYEKQE